MGKFCCFFCPAKDYTEKSLSDVCPSCGRKYGFVLENIPSQIEGYRIKNSLGRGFYGAAYIAEKGKFNKKYVIKITPVNFYTFFNKPSFDDETSLHNELAQNANHIIGIEDSFSATVEFSEDHNAKIDCYVAVLEYVEGSLLRDYLDGTIQNLSAATVCQIAIDLLFIRSEFETIHLNHNDFHAENLIVERLPITTRRPDALDDTIRVKAIDLGSISDESKSSINRDGDLSFIAKHLDKLLAELLKNTDALEDREYRVALALQTIVNGLHPVAQNVRRPSTGDLIGQIRESYYRASSSWRPWNQPLTLKSFGDHYNAQTLESWNVPQLLVDPNEEWLSEVKKSGPQIITGMRGCGKTMLMRAMDIHARASRLNQDETPTEIIRRLKSDGFVGLYVSAQRLLDLREQSLLKLEHRLTRLFVNYSLQAVRALLHIKDLKLEVVEPRAHIILTNAIADYLNGAENLREISSLENLERQLERIVVVNSRGDNTYVVNEAPAIVFPHLATSFRKCSEIFNSSLVLFLLDDVSTRYLDLDKIDSILSATLFQSPCCAFKFTSEWQTVELGLRSPGRNHPIRVGRDVDVFDLGARVFEIIKGKGNQGKEFVSKILKQRAGFHPSAFQLVDPKQLLGDISLEEIANEIASYGKTSGQLKNVYRGLSCLSNVCVGDIGDVIKLYEEILRRASFGVFPVAQNIQSDCFQGLSSHRLYDLNRRDHRYKNHAIAFAEAAHDLLVRSKRLSSSQTNGKPRLRQYSSLYVRVTAEDETIVKSQIDMLRELIDAGVFVYTGGAPRTKTKDSNPIQQFKLSYRKIYGLASYIGLSDRDRFEMSGSDLQEWLNKPSKAKEILIRNQINDKSDSWEEDELNDGVDSSPNIQENETKNHKLEQINLVFSQGTDRQEDLIDASQISKIDFAVKRISMKELSQIEIERVVAGLGFEERTLEANIRLSSITKPKQVDVIQYSNPGYSKKILDCWSNGSTTINKHSYNTSYINLPNVKGQTLIDVSGLSKPLIFQVVKRELSEKGHVIVCHATAKQYYPLQEDIESVFAAEKSNDPCILLESLASILKGESGEYSAIKLLPDLADPLRDRTLISFASAKHERLFSLLDRRDYNFVEVIAPTGNEPWKRVAQLAADVLIRNYQNARISNVDIQDLAGLINYLDEQFIRLYCNAGANFEFGLTGSKMQAVAAAVLSSQRKVSQAWYLSPKEFDEKRFSSGVGEIRLYDIKVPRGNDV